MRLRCALPLSSLPMARMGLVLLTLLAAGIAGCSGEPVQAGREPPVEVENRLPRPLDAVVQVAPPDGEPFLNASGHADAGEVIVVLLPRLAFGTYELRAEVGERSRSALVDFDATDQAFRFVIEPERIAFRSR